MTQKMPMQKQLKLFMETIRVDPEETSITTSLTEHHPDRDNSTLVGEIMRDPNRGNLALAGEFMTDPDPGAKAGLIGKLIQIWRTKL